MNGNELADVLKYPGGEWRAHEPLPKEWWKTDFPYGEALEMGYQLSPEETRKYYERRGEWPTPEKSEEEKIRAELDAFNKQITKLMYSPEFMALSEMEKYSIHNEIRTERNKITDRMEKKVQAGRVAQKQAEADVSVQRLLSAAGKGIIDEAQLVYFLEDAGWSPEKIKTMTDVVPDKLNQLDEVNLQKARREEEAAGRPFPTTEVRKLLTSFYNEEIDDLGLAAGLYGLKLPDEQVKNLTPIKMDAYKTLQAKQLAGVIDEDVEDRRVRAELKKLYPEMATKDFSYQAWQDTKIAYLNYELDVKAGKREEATDKLNDFVQRENIAFRSEQAIIGQKNWETEQQNSLNEIDRQYDLDVKELGHKIATEKKDSESRRIESVGEIRAIEYRHEENVTKLGQEQADSLRDHERAIVNDKFAQGEVLHQRGVTDKEFIQDTYEFMETMQWNKDKFSESTRQFDVREENIMERFGVTEAGVTNRFEKGLAVEIGNLNLAIRKQGWTELEDIKAGEQWWADYSLQNKTEERIATMAILTYALKVKELGLDEAKHWLETVKAEKGWYFKEKTLQLDNEKANVLFLKTMSDIANNAEKVGIEQALADANIDIAYKKLEFDYTELEQKAQAEGTGAIEISSDLSVTLGNMSPEIQNDVTRMIKTVYDDKKGFYHPSDNEMIEISEFLFGAEDENRPKDRFAVNLDKDEFIRTCTSKFNWSDEVKGWCIMTRDKEYLWQNVINAGVTKGVYISPDIEEAVSKPGWFETGVSKTLGKIGETFKNWFTFTEPTGAGVGLAPQVTKTGNISTDAEKILRTYGEEISRSDMHKYLFDIGYSESEINSLMGG